MNALTKIPDEATELSLPADIAVHDWVEIGRNLFAKRRSIDWMLADWVAAGVNRQFDLDLVEGLCVEPKQLRQAARIADAFPAHLRASDVPFEVHAYLAALPEERRLETLQRASTEHWGVKRAKEAVTHHRQEAAMFEDNDPERLATLIYRAWNNAGPEIREHAWPLLKAAAHRGFTIVDEEEVLND